MSDSTTEWQDWNAFMTTFDKREEAFEKRFALDEEQKFKAVARRNKLFGLWVAEKLGKSGDEASAYAKELVTTAIEGGEAAVVRKITGDLADQGHIHRRSRTARQVRRADGAGGRAGQGGDVSLVVIASEREAIHEATRGDGRIRFAARSQ